ncbi:MAG: Gfo/Idh/MocA family oxidoreductase [Acidimicrobiales bacterium]
MTVGPRLKVGVIGAGMIAQIMHLPYLRELEEHFDLRALCDASRSVVDGCGRRFGVERLFTDWRELLEEDLDAVLVLTSGSHAPVAVAAAEAGMHVLVEKPMCYSVAEGAGMIEAASAAGVVLMVGYPKRYDPAYRRVRDEVRGLGDLRFVRLTTMESPFQPYVAHYRLLRGDDVAPELVEQWRADSDRRVDEAIGEVSELERRSYAGVLLDTMVHEFNLLRGVLGEPTELKFVSLCESTTTVVLDFDGVDCVVAWLDLPGIARYEMEVCFYDPAERVRLAFPSPYLKNAPRLVDIETGELAGPASAAQRELVSYEEPFKLELLEFHRAIADGVAPLTSGADGLRDIALCQNVIASSSSSSAIAFPTAVTAP